MTLVAGCSSKTKVGSESLKDFEDQAQDRLGTTTTKATTSTTAAGPTQTTTATVATTIKTTTTLSAKQVVTIAIQGDLQGDAFKPRCQPVYPNGIVRWVNRDTSVHGVQAQRGEWQPHEIAPGASWDFTVNLSPGVYEYKDTHRTYAIAYLVVLPASCPS
jgi:plastocyanin